MVNPKFTIFKSSRNGEYYYRLKARNGETILNGEGYTSKQGCLTGIASVKSNAPFDSRYDRRRSVNDQYYFNLKATNGEIIGRSEMYVSRQGMENGIDAVKRDAPIAPIEDLTLARAY